MKKTILVAVFALSLIAGVASAQSYYSGSCLAISSNLTVGSRGAQVRALQTFLVAQNYPGGGSWMQTGYFGQATAAALRLFQQSQGLPQTSMTDPATISALQSVSCGGYSTGSYSYPGYPGSTGSYNYNFNSNPYSTTSPYGSTYPYSTTYPYTYPYNTYGYGAPVITSLSQNTGTPGQTVTIYGQGFDPSYNTVNFGGQTVSGSASGSGTSVTFTVPYIAYSYGINQNIQLSVTDSRGTSNTVTFTLNPIINYSNGNCGNGYTYNCGCGTYPNAYGYNSGNCGCGSGAYNCPTQITYLIPQSGGVGTNVTIYGSGFTTNNNTVHFGNGIITGLQSPDGRSVSFIVPSQLTGYGTQPVVIGSYNVSVTNGSNVTSNAIPFSVTSTQSGNGGQPTISNVSGPTNLSSGQQGTWTMTVNTNGNSYTSVSAAWGDTVNGYVNMAAPQQVYGTQTVTFTHAYMNAGTYTLTFTVASQNGQSNTYTSTVYVSGSASQNGVPYISYLTPQSGYVGTQVTIYGSNFSTNNNNIVYFGSGAIQNVYSNGSSITFTVPSYTTPYCQSGYACPQYAQQVTPGSYNVSVNDPWGTSNSVPFTVL